MRLRPVITLTTDFGTADAYVGTMKGVMLGIAPDCSLVDITHQIAPQDVRQAAFVLFAMYRYFPSRAVHLVVVDPGVGSQRRAIAAQVSHGRFVAPDNGILSYVLADTPRSRIVELANPQYWLAKVSATFHGRDVFAPAAAHLASGLDLADLGPSVEDPILLPPPRLEIGANRITGEVIYIDHFGNAITSIGRLVSEAGILRLRPVFSDDAAVAQSLAIPSSEDRVRVLVVGHEVIGLHHTYAGVMPHHALALVGSAGWLEIAVREGHAAQTLGLSPGDAVTLDWT
jgi:S-adenosylmethionine hydrolase